MLPWRITGVKRPADRFESQSGDSTRDLKKTVTPVTMASATAAPAQTAQLGTSMNTAVANIARALYTRISPVDHLSPFLKAPDVIGNFHPGYRRRPGRLSCCTGR